MENKKETLGYTPQVLFCDNMPFDEFMTYIDEFVRLNKELKNSNKKLFISTNIL